jgi:hypothetical protein
VTLRADVVAQLRAHGVEPAPGESPRELQGRLYDRYMEDVRALKARQQRGLIPLREYAGHAAALKARYPLLALPLPSWEE